ncbi:MAG TPA: hypothetical protein ENN95_02070, partial [Deltaproteobacteria bacterium]|nr:hypothetical protein [Deltaproteobacteria bacterium]
MKYPAKSGAALLMGGQFLFVVTTYIIHLYLARRLDVESYGDYALTLSLLQSLQIAIQNGVPEIHSREIARNGYSKNARLSALKTQVIYSMAVMGILAIAGPLFASAFGDKTWIIYLWLGALLVPARAAFLVLKAAFNGSRMYGHDAGLIVFYSIIRIVPVVVLVEMGFGVTGVIVGFVIGAAVAAFGAYLLKTPDSKDSYIKTNWKTLFYSSLPVTFFGILYNSLANMDLILLRLLGDSQFDVGLYGAVWTISRAGFVMLLSLSFAALPAVSASVQSLKLMKHVKRSTGLAFLATFAILAVLVVDGKGVLELFYPDAYGAGGRALAVAYTGSIFIAFAVLQGNILIAFRRQQKIYLPFLAAISTCIFAAFLLIPPLGIMGAAFVIAIGGIVSFTLMSFIAGKHSSLPDFKLLFCVAVSFGISLI